MQPLLFETALDLQEILNHVARAECVYLKFLAANDLGLTGSHQDGLYLSKRAWKLFLDAPGAAGENIDRFATLEWGRGLATDSRFVWYGKETRSEYRLTRIAPVFRGQEERYLGSLFLLLRLRSPADGSVQFQARLLDREEDIDDLLAFLGVTPAETNDLIAFQMNDRVRPFYEAYLREVGDVFPDTNDISRRAQAAYAEIYRAARHSPDEMLLSLMEIEYALFQGIERAVYQPLLSRQFTAVEELLALSSEVNNRRKSRAGRSFENHLVYVLNRFRVRFSFNQTTEDSKKPDFIFPGIEQYHARDFPGERLFFLGAKTTCKDRWRQVLNEADRIARKHLCTLQQGFTTQQLQEMREAGVTLVVPEKYHAFCKEADRSQLISLAEFVERVNSANGLAEDLFSQAPA